MSDMRIGRRSVMAASMVAATLFATGCGGTIATSQAVLATPEATIEGQGFTIVPSKAFDVPFLLPVWKKSADDMPNAHKRWLTQGAQRVKVVLTSTPEPLYGVVSFHKLPSWAKGPATRSFSMRIDPRFVSEASDGRISVVYESVTDGSGSKEAFAWVLWLSDRPF